MTIKADDINWARDALRNGKKNAIAKQEIFNILYKFEGNESVLDVGCGDDYKQARAIVKEYYALDLLDGLDWYEWAPIDVDVIIANDLFPNVDQRLELFLEQYLPHCKEMRLSLTYFDEPHWYRATRPEGEVITMLSMTYDDIENIFDRVNVDYIDGALLLDRFSNSRIVRIVWLKGGLA